MRYFLLKESMFDFVICAHDHWLKRTGIMSRVVQERLSLYFLLGFVTETKSCYVFEGCMRFFPPEMFAGRSGSWTGGDGAWVELSGKVHVLAHLLGHLRTKTDDRIVLVSNYTQTLDLIVQLCRERRYPFLRLDGTTSISKRQKLVNCFNDPSKDEFAFLLSSKAGGCGLNLIGGNRLVLFDPDWNPANDKQATARVWREGQKKRVYSYRFLGTGTVEVKVYQRQMSKEGLQKVIQQELADSKMQGDNFSTEDLRDLFTFYEDATFEIHGKMNCTRCGEHTADAICMDEEEDIGGFAGISGCLHNLKRSEDIGGFWLVRFITKVQFQHI